MKVICSSFLSVFALLWPFTLVGNARGYSHVPTSRSRFLERVAGGFVGTVAATSMTSVSPPTSNAIEFVPASPNFSGTYRDAVEIMQAQRLAVDNISNVIHDGNMEEAGFKVMQLNAQTTAAGKIILDTSQEKLASYKGGSGDGSVMLLRYLSCQKKFATLTDLCEDCGDSLRRALKKDDNVGAKATVKKLKASSVVEETKSAYDDFLAEMKTFEEATAAGKR